MKVVEKDEPKLDWQESKRIDEMYQNT